MIGNVYIVAGKKFTSIREAAAFLEKTYMKITGCESKITGIYFLIITPMTVGKRSLPGSHLKGPQPLA